MGINDVVVLFCMLAAAALIWWGISKLPLPPVVSTIVAVLFGLLCIGWVMQAFGVGRRWFGR